MALDGSETQNQRLALVGISLDGGRCWRQYPTALEERGLVVRIVGRSARCCRMDARPRARRRVAVERVHHGGDRVGLRGEPGTGVRNAQRFSQAPPRREGIMTLPAAFGGRALALPAGRRRRDGPVPDTGGWVEDCESAALALNSVVRGKLRVDKFIAATDTDESCVVGEHGGEAVRAAGHCATTRRISESGTIASRTPATSLFRPASSRTAL